MRVVAAGLVLAGLLACSGSLASQREEPLAPAVATLLSTAVADSPVPPRYAEQPAVATWIREVSGPVAQRIADPQERQELLATLHYEATRAGLAPDLMLGVLAHESNFRKYAVSSAGARGYLQVMPFWLQLIGVPGQNLFHLRTNLRYGCTILRHYLDQESGDLVRALARYNGSLGRTDYPQAVRAASRRWHPE